PVARGCVHEGGSDKCSRCVGFHHRTSHVEPVEKRATWEFQIVRIADDLTDRIGDDVGGATRIAPARTRFRFEGLCSGISRCTWNAEQHVGHVRKRVAIVFVELQAASHVKEVLQGNLAAWVASSLPLWYRYRVA